MAREAWVYIDTGEVFAVDSDGFANLDHLIATLPASDDETGALIAAAPKLLAALKGAVGALEFSRDYHNDLGNEEQAFAQDKLDAALAAITAAEGGQ